MEKAYWPKRTTQRLNPSLEGEVRAQLFLYRSPWSKIRLLVSGGGPLPTRNFLSLPPFVSRGTLLVGGGFMRIMHSCISLLTACFYVIGYLWAAGFVLPYERLPPFPYAYTVSLGGEVPNFFAPAVHRTSV